jgi:hypothetical protein
MDPERLIPPEEPGGDLLIEPVRLFRGSEENEKVRMDIKQGAE